ncbi:hypothetical protein D3C78_1671570 [compost metagenome]
MDSNIKPAPPTLYKTNNVTTAAGTVMNKVLTVAVIAEVQIPPKYEYTVTINIIMARTMISLMPNIV